MPYVAGALRNGKLFEYSISSDDDESVDALTTSTPLLEITYVRRRKRRLKNYLAGAGRVAVHIDRDLQRSLSSNEGSVLSEEGIPADRRELRNVPDGALQYCRV